MQEVVGMPPAAWAEPAETPAPLRSGGPASSMRVTRPGAGEGDATRRCGGAEKNGEDNRSSTRRWRYGGGGDSEENQISVTRFNIHGFLFSVPPPLRVKPRSVRRPPSRPPLTIREKGDSRTATPPLRLPFVPAGRSARTAKKDFLGFIASDCSPGSYGIHASLASWRIRRDMASRRSSEPY